MDQVLSALENVPVQVVIAVLVLIGSQLVLHLIKREKPKKKFLTREKQSVKLASKTDLSHDTRLFVFNLPEDHVLGLPPGRHIKVIAPNPNVGRLEWNSSIETETDETVERNYTPTSSDNVTGEFHLLVKVYRPNEQFPNGGKASQYLDSVSVGENIQISGPWGLTEYLGLGNFKSGNKKIKANQVGMIAGGTGITPMLSVIEAVLDSPQDPTKLSLIFGNQTPDDVLLQDRIEHIAKIEASRFNCTFTVDRPSANWKYLTGYVTAQMIRDHLPAPDEATVVLLCGPPPMVSSCKAILLDLKYPKSNILEFK